jgi:hypothetical protein
MARMLDPFQFLLVSIAGWMNQDQQQVIEYLREEASALVGFRILAYCLSDAQ